MAINAERLVIASQGQLAVKDGELRSGWRILVACVFGVALGFPTLAVYSLGVFAPEFRGEIGSGAGGHYCPGGSALGDGRVSG